MVLSKFGVVSSAKQFDMDTILHIYEANNQYLDQTTLISLVILVLCLLGLGYNYKRTVARDQRNTQKLISLLLGFVILLACSAAFFSKLTSKRIGPVKVFPNRIESNEGTIQATRIKRAYMHQSTPNSPFQLNTLGDSSLLFIIEEVDGRAHVFPEDNYPVEQMMDDLRPWLLEATGGEK